jgi:hypothetical protein
LEPNTDGFDSGYFAPNSPPEGFGSSFFGSAGLDAPKRLAPDPPWEPCFYLSSGVEVDG